MVWKQALNSLTAALSKSNNLCVVYNSLCNVAIMLMLNVNQ